MNRRHRFLDESQSTKNIKKYLEQGVFIQICWAGDMEYEQTIDTYFKNNINEQKLTKQSGRTWILLNEYNGCLKAITIGQSQNIKNELLRIISYMHSNDAFEQKKKEYYRKLYKECRKIYFYEVDINAFVRKYCNDFVPDITNNLLYEITKDYLAEALLAYYTAASDWDYSWGGMDKRFYFHLLDYIEEKEANK